VSEDRITDNGIGGVSVYNKKSRVFDIKLWAIRWRVADYGEVRSRLTDPQKLQNAKNGIGGGSLTGLFAGERRMAID
jgi:hypothetical protein